MSHPANIVETSLSENTRARAEAAGVALAGAIRFIARIWRCRTLATMAETEAALRHFKVVLNDWPQR